MMTPLDGIVDSIVGLLRKKGRTQRSWWKIGIATTEGNHENSLMMSPLDGFVDSSLADLCLLRKKGRTQRSWLKIGIAISEGKHENSLFGDKMIL